MPQLKRLCLIFLSASFFLAGCNQGSRHTRTVVVAIESSPSSLDPRVGTDAQAERIDGLMFEPLVRKDAHWEMQPALAERWEEQPDGMAWIFHLRDGAHFQDGRALAAEDVAWTLRSMMDGTVVTSKGGAFAASVAGVDVLDRLTLRIRMKHPDQGLLFHLSDGEFGVVPRGSGRGFGDHPVGSGRWQFVSQEIDKEVVLEQTVPLEGIAGVRRVRFAVVPDAVTTALELEKGSADLAVNAITLDMVHALETHPGVAVAQGPGSPVMYLNFNVARGPLADQRVRQAIAYAMDRQAIVEALWRGHARLAGSLLPPGHWAAAPGMGYPHAPASALALLDAAGYRPGKDGVRLRLEMKTSTDETTRLLAVILQAQLRQVGIALTVRSAEFGTFYADVTRGAFEMYALRWIGSNEDPEIFRYAFGSGLFPPRGGNRGHYSNLRVDQLLQEAGATVDREVRRRDYLEVQRILMQEVPAIPLWFPDNHVVYRTRLQGVQAEGAGSYDFLDGVTVRPR